MGLIASMLRSARRAVVLGLDPLRFRQEMLKRSNSKAPFSEKVAYDAMPRPQFGYGLYKSALQAKGLGLTRISALEFGCAGGRGLIELEEVAKQVHAELGVQVDVFGFDLGEGLPRPLDYRDLPYAWQAGQFKMDVPALQARLTTARLIIGDVADTVEQFRSREGLAPVGFISFDQDFYSSTVAALRIFEGGHAHLLPRVYCYFDDCIGPDNELHCEYVGELLAIKEFNESHSKMKLAPINSLARKRIIPAAWNDAMFVLHAFEHPRYGHYLPTGVDMELSLGGSA
jgi:hypothetical protein